MKDDRKAENGTARETDDWQLCLYVAGKTPAAQAALENIKLICETYLQGHYQLRVIDLRDQPEIAEIQQIIAVPTLVRELPMPPRKVIGDLSQERQVLGGLGIHARVNRGGR